MFQNLVHKQSKKNWREKNRDYPKKWRNKNKEKWNAYKRFWNKQNAEKNPKFRLDRSMAVVVSMALKGKKAGRSWEDLTGYSIEDLMKHFESQFDNKMTWNNYGSYWWVDHIKPQSLFRYESAEDPEFKKCWALENLQPLEKIANIKKHNKYKE